MKARYECCLQLPETPQMFEQSSAVLLQQVTLGGCEIFLAGIGSNTQCENQHQYLNRPKQGAHDILYL